MSRETDLAWLAGMIDGEGHIALAGSIKRRSSPTLVLVVTGCDVTGILRCQQIAGCGIFQPRDDPRQRRPYYRWYVGSLQARSVLEQVRPYLVIKAPQVDLALRAQVMVSAGRSKGKPNVFREDINWIKLAISCLNRGIEVGQEPEELVWTPTMPRNRLELVP